MCIKKFLLVSYIASIMVGGCWLYYEKVFDLLGIDDIQNKNEILLEIYIPRIKLKKFVYNIDSTFNNVDYNIEILEESNLENNLFYLASHSGSGRASYFDYLIYLEKGDFIFVNSINNKYNFVVEDIFYIQKNGYFIDSYNSVDNTLFLITCSLDYVSRQLVIKANMVC